MTTRRAFLSGTCLASLALALSCVKKNDKFQVYFGPKITKIDVYKSKKILDLYSNGQLIKRYKMELGFAPRGHKKFEGDGKTPEGLYYIDRKNPNSRYYLSIGLSYPNAEDRRKAKKAGKSPGGDIFIHGTPSLYIGLDDWTWGCIAVSNSDMKEIYSMIDIGTKIELYP